MREALSGGCVDAASPGGAAPAVPAEWSTPSALPVPIRPPAGRASRSSSRTSACGGPQQRRHGQCRQPHAAATTHRPTVQLRQLIDARQPVVAQVKLLQLGRASIVKPPEVAQPATARRVSDSARAIEASGRTHLLCARSRRRSEDACTRPSRLATLQHRHAETSDSQHAEVACAAPRRAYGPVAAQVQRMQRGDGGEEGGADALRARRERV